MKKLAVFTLMVMFLANTVVVSAWAKPCMNSGSVEMTQEMSANMDSDMPCHDEKPQNEKKNQNKHCDGICLCLHASLSQTPITNDFDALALPDISKQQIAISQDALASRTTLPLRRPPKSTS